MALLLGQHLHGCEDQGSVGLVKPSGTEGAPLVAAQMVPSRILSDHEDQGQEAEQ